MQSKEKDNLVFIRLFPGEYIHEELEKACRKHCAQTAVVLSGIGQMTEFELGYFKTRGDYSPEKYIEPHELLALSGNMIRQDGEYLFHLHAVLGNEEKAAIGGHLISGRVAITNEIVLLKDDISIFRRLEEETGLKGLYME